MGFRIAIVDDHPVVRDGLRMTFLRDSEFEVVGDAGDGTAAKALIEAQRPGLVLLDVAMPVEGGLSVIKWIRAHHESIRVLLLTGNVNSPEVQACLLAGADGVITKNIAAEELLKAARAVASGGTYLSPEATQVVVSAMRSQMAGDRGLSQLTAQETVVLRGIAEGLSFKEIALRMNLSPKTVETYRARLVKKTGLRGKVALARYAVEQGLDREPAV